jgi:hypothetical protein
MVENIFIYFFLGGGHIAFTYFSTYLNHMYNESLVHVCTEQHFPKQPYTLVGFEPGSSDPQADAMPTAPRLQGNSSF